MITLITGVPGTGKTCHVVDWLSKLTPGERPLYVDNIRELVIPHEVAPDVTQWPDWAPEGALIVIDECQRHFRPRASSAAVPRCVAEFETHRHRGLDFWLITQHPNLLDSNIRRLITRHVHFRRTWAGRYMHEWHEVGDVDSRVSRDLSVAKRVKLPKAAFQLYKSAEVHTKTKLTIPGRVYLLFGCLALVGYLGWSFYSSFQKRIPPDSKKVVQSGQGGAPSQGPAQPGPTGANPASALASNLPRRFGLPHTAPKYDQLTVPQRVPVPAACIQSKNSCTCWTQDATRLTVDKLICQEIVKNGYFIDFVPSPVQSEAPGPSRSAPPVATGEVVQHG